MFELDQCNLLAGFDFYAKYRPQMLQALDSVQQQLKYVSAHAFFELVSCSSTMSKPKLLCGERGDLDRLDQLAFHLSAYFTYLCRKRSPTTYPIPAPSNAFCFNAIAIPAPSAIGIREMRFLG